MPTRSLLHSTQRLALTVMFALICADARGQETLFKCTIKDGVHVEHGTLARTVAARQWVKFLNPMIVDVSTGLIRTGQPEVRWKWRVVQKGDARNDWMLKPDRDPFAEEREKDDDVIRIRDWANGSPRQIVYYRFGGLFSGTCEPVN